MSITNIIKYGIILYVVYNILTRSFSDVEMFDMETNCKNTAKNYFRLNSVNSQKMSNLTSKIPNKLNTERDIINDNLLLYDDVGKEIVARLDMASNCQQLNDAQLDNINFDSMFDQSLLSPNKLQNPNPIEEKTNAKYYAADLTYTDVNYLSDPSFLQRLSEWKN